MKTKEITDNIINEARHGFETSLQIVLFSHLSDIQEGYMTGAQLRIRINFVKFLLNKYPNTKIHIDADKEWEEFLEKHGK